MYNIVDDDFMTEIGIIDMPEPARGELVKGIQQNISDRILLALSDQINDFLTNELEQINGSPDFAKNWLEKNIPHYAGSPEFAQFSQFITGEGIDTTQLYAQSKWFEMNLPTFPAVVEQVRNSVKQELKTINGK